MASFVSKNMQAKTAQAAQSGYLPGAMNTAERIFDRLGMKPNNKGLMDYSDDQLNAVHTVAQAAFNNSLDPSHASYVSDDELAATMTDVKRQYKTALSGTDIGKKAVGVVGKFTALGVAGGLGGFGVGFYKTLSFFMGNKENSLMNKVGGALIGLPVALAAGAVVGSVGLITGGLIGTPLTGFLGGLKDKAMDMIGKGKAADVDDLLNRAAELGRVSAVEKGVAASVRNNVDQEQPKIENQQQTQPEQKVNSEQPAADASQTFQPIDAQQPTAAVAQSARAAITDPKALAEYDLTVISKYMNDARVMGNADSKAAIEAAYKEAVTKATTAGMSEADIKAVKAMKTDQFVRLDAATLHDFSEKFGMERVIQTTMNQAGKDLVAAHRKTLGATEPVTQTVEEQALEATKAIRNVASTTISKASEDPVERSKEKLVSLFKILARDNLVPEMREKAENQLKTALGTLSGRNTDDINGMTPEGLTELLQNVCNSNDIAVPPQIPQSLSQGNVKVRVA